MLQRFLVPIACLLWQGAALAAAGDIVRLEITNGNGVPGVAEEASQDLDDNPFRVVRVGDAPSFNYGQTFILHREGFAAMAEILASRLPVKGWIRQIGALDEGVDVRLLLGRDYAHHLSQVQAAPPQPAKAVTAAATGDVAPAEAVRLEVSNGNGVAGMASRLGGYLRERDYAVFSLTNADSYDHRRSVIFYRPGLRERAEDLASILPVGNIRLEENSRQAVELRLVIGRDFVSYDINRLRPSAPRQVAGD